jgi:phosphoenolpyruvate carboxykinase (GTP)
LIIDIFILLENKLFLGLFVNKTEIIAVIPDVLKQIPKLYEWLQEVVDLVTPSKVSLFLDPIKDDQRCTHTLLQTGALKVLKDPGCYYIATDPQDTARVEASTFICTQTEQGAGITNNWQDPKKMRAHLKNLFKGCMQGREMVVIPYCMGPWDSAHKVLGVEITDSLYVAISMRRMTRCGQRALDLIKKQGTFIPGIHSVGCPLQEGQKDVLWPCNPKDRVIAHFPETGEIFSYGSGYGGNALLAKKCLSLRIGSYLGYKHHFLAEHMLIMGIQNPQGVKKYFLAAFPSSCGKTNLAMLESTMPGWKITCVGDDIAWIHVDKQGRWRAINPEFGFFGVAPGTSMSSNPTAMRMIKKDTLFTNTGYTDEGQVYWEGMGDIPPYLMTWTHQVYDGHEKAAHPNSRFTTPLENCDRLDSDYLNPEGVEISAIVFGGRRAEAVALVAESFNFEHGVFLGATLSSETTAASLGELGKVRQDPFAMLPFCGYNMGSYFSHWLEMGKLSNPPKIFQVNWFRKDRNGQYLWPGFGDNLRVLKWIFERCDHQHQGIRVPYGIIPQKSELDLEGLNTDYDQLFAIDPSILHEERLRQKAFLDRFGSGLPEELRQFF